MASDAESERERIQKQRAELRTDMATWTPTWRLIDQYIVPGRYREFTNENNQGTRKDSKIINNKSRIAHRNARAGMMAGITSPSRPWFRLATPDYDLNEYGPVKAWLDTVTRRMRELLLKSNFYNGLSVLYGDLLGFGHAAVALEDDDEDTIRLYSFPVGSYVLANSDRGVVDTFMRDSRLSVRGLITKFGGDGGQRLRPGQSIRWENFSTNVKSLWERSNYQKPVDIVHAITPNPFYDPRRLQAKYKRWRSVYFEVGNQERTDQFLRESGYDEFPILSPRWDPVAEDVYSQGPGWDALGDSKGLQTLERQKAQAIEKSHKPPMTAPLGLRNQRASVLPGDVTYLDVREGQQGFKPAYEVKPDIQGLLLDIGAHEKRISSAFYEDLFLMLASSDRREITAREVDERHEEKMLMLGPVLERLNDELYDPGIDRVFNIMDRRGDLPLPPPELEGMKLRVEYVSIMAQAQKLIAIGGVERVAGFVGGIIKTIPEAHAEDKIDVDNLIDEYAEMVGTPARIVRSTDEAKARRAERAKVAERAQAAALADQAAGAAQKLGNTPMSGDSALTRMLDINRGTGTVAAGVPPGVAVQ